MGTLADITSKASNKNMRNLNSPMGIPKNAPSQSDGNGKSNFMSPTMASTKKTNASPISKDDTRNSTPTSVRLEKASTAKWMTSAAKRVGLRRVTADGTPRSKKEGLKLSSNAVTFPDKLSGFSYSKMPESPQPKPQPLSMLSDKPLPSPPVAQVMTSSYGEPRSLIDASEQPLRRTSPKSPRKQEEWPVLFPQKPTTPDAIRQILHQTTPEPVRLTSNGQERYPRLSGSQSANASLAQEPVTRLPPTVQIQRKQVSTNNLRENNAATSAANGGLGNDAHEATSKHSDSVPRDLKKAHRLSAGAAAVEKSTAEAKSVKEPRPTRTSSLRARIAAGQVIKDSPNKVLGFTDFTAERLPSANTSKEEMGSAAGSNARPSTSFGKVFTKKPSKEFLAGTRAPAQFVAGSRRPVARRPSSRNSLRSEAKASSPTSLEPSAPASAIPTTRTDTSSRKSSIPLFRNTVPTTTDGAYTKYLPIAHSMSIPSSEVGVPANDNFRIFDDRSNASTQDVGNSIAATAGGSDHMPALESIAESPKSTFRSKRLSSNSPTFGPMLKISSSADRLIMGTEGVNKENRPVAKTKSKELFRAVVTNEHRNSMKSKTLDHEAKNSTERPIPSQGVPEILQRDGSVTDAPKAAKVKAANLHSISTTHKLEGDAYKKSAEKTSKDNGSLGAMDTFVTTIEQRERPSNGTGEENQEAVRESFYSANPEPFIWPVEISPTPMSDAIPIVPAFLPRTLQKHVEKSGGISEITGANGVKERTDGYGTIPRDANFFEQSAPSTPKQTSENDTETSSSSFPPRSSSRMQHPDYTMDGSAKGSSTSSLDHTSTHLQNEISVYDFAKPNVSDADSFSRPIIGGPKKSHREISSQTINTDVTSKRDSAIRISHRSQSSVSKGLMSNFRGLFHKRTSDASETPTVRSNKKGSKRPTVNSHGSPSPSMSNIHPLHRPTQASINRTNATIQRSSGNSLLAAGAPSTPSFNSPLPTEISTTTSLAMQILESARMENSSPKKERLLSLGKIMVDSITQARDAEKAMEEAKQAARKAEVAYILCKKSVADVAGMVQGWRDN
ncbi:MAG: hypothetical protein Q9186_003312 [Xanthomendoza sp. 1 TL-2023]